MRNCRLTLNRELLTPLQSDELASIAGAGISRPHTACEITNALCTATSLAYSHCPDMSCGFGCTANCS